MRYTILLLIIIQILGCSEDTQSIKPIYDPDVRKIKGSKLYTTKHLYIISACSGQVIFYSSVYGKVTTYGSSVPYIFWWDTNGIYHQHYISGGQIVHISDQPIEVKSANLSK